MKIYNLRLEVKILKVEVKLYAFLRKNRNSKYLFDIEQGSAPNVLVSLVNINLKDVKIVLVNGRVENMNFGLHEGDIVSFYPAIGGG